MVLINGAPASGKSTLARLLAQDHALTLVLDIDSIRGCLGLWEQDPAAAGIAARRLALNMASTHLAAGADVIVPQFLGRADFVIELETIAASVGADFYEVVLVSSPQEASERFESRSTSDEPKPSGRQETAGCPRGRIHYGYV
jgi:predicted kinase